MPKKSQKRDVDTTHSSAPQKRGESASDLVYTVGSSPDIKSENCNASLLRLLDASANRATEGLRVIEDYVRFVLDDRYFTESTKQIRHDLASIITELDPASRCATRETSSDVGTTITTAQERARPQPRDVLIASFERVKQSLRSLEEYFKLFSSEAASRIEAIRYRFYSLEKGVVVGISSRDRLTDVKLCLLVDGEGKTNDFGQKIKLFIESGASMIQLREKGITDGELLQRARSLLPITRAAGALLIINDRPDIAAASHADGVHLGQDDMPLSAARSILGPEPLIGVSTHSIEQARRAVEEGANYIGMGPLFPSSTKSFDAFPGLPFIQQVNEEISLPAFAIGGITEDNLEEVKAAGAQRVAMAGAIHKAEDPARLIKAIIQKLS